MKLTVIGCSGSYPGPDSPASSYLLEHDGHQILLDMGNGSAGALQRYADPYSLDAIFISHLHVDHFIDLTSYYVMRKWHPEGAKPILPVHGPAGTHERLVSAYGGSPISSEPESRRAGRASRPPRPRRRSNGGVSVNRFTRKVNSWRKI